MKDSKPVVVGIGELLWDVLPTGKRAGGAPINFVYHATQLGAEGYAVSAVGNDVFGTEIVQELDKNGICHLLGDSRISYRKRDGGVERRYPDLYDYRRCCLGSYTFDSGSRRSGERSGCHLLRYVGAAFARIACDDSCVTFLCP